MYNVIYKETFIEGLTDLWKQRKDIVNMLTDAGMELDEGTRVYIYPNVTEFGKMNLLRGYYEDLDLDTIRDYGDLPDPLQYFDYEKFGRDYIATGYDKCIHEMPETGEIVLAF